MKEKSIKSLPIYPEYRKSFYPTTSKIFYNFDGISSYKILKDGKVIKEFRDCLSSAQKIILSLLDMDGTRINIGDSFPQYLTGINSGKVGF